MSNLLNLISEEVFAEKLDTANTLLAAIASGGGGIKFSSFRDLQRLTRLGLASKVLAIGDQVVSERAVSVSAEVGSTDGTPGISGASVNKDAFLAAIGEAHAGEYVFSYDGVTWRFGDVPVLLSAYGITVTGTPEAFDEIVVQETADRLVWDVIGIDVDTPADPQFTHSVTLELHDPFASYQFCAKAALFAFPSGLAAGTYHFKVTEHRWVSSDSGKSFQFTLTQAIPAGGQFKLNAGRNDPLAGTTANVYSGAASETVIETVTLSEGTGGTDLGNVGNAVSGNTNSLEAVLTGDARYSTSAIRQYLNSSAAAGSVWSPQTPFDRPPAWASDAEGFLNGMDPELVSVVGAVTKKTALNTVSAGGGTETSEERFFLPSRSEVYGGNEVTGGEGAAYPYYANYSDLSAAGTGNDTNRIKYAGGVASSWMLRSPNATYVGHIRDVTTSGGLSFLTATSSPRVAPCCCIV